MTDAMAVDATALPSLDGSDSDVDMTPPPNTLSAKYPGDVGIDGDPDLVFHENFEEGSVAAVVARYDSHKNQPGMALVADLPAKTSGKAAMRFTAGGTAQATDLYKKLSPGYDELYVRYYVKYVGTPTWHHTGVWFGGYNPPTSYPNPQAGIKPVGDDRFSIALEPMNQGANPRIDFYNYWMNMHSWMSVPMGSTAYYGNALINDVNLRWKTDAWMCVEIHSVLNPNPANTAGGVLELWIDDKSIVRFDDNGPKGYWVKDKFCPQGATLSSCSMYAPPPNQQNVILDRQLRSTSALKLNYFWPQNYITQGTPGDVLYDDMVLARSRIGCLQ